MSINFSISIPLEDFFHYSIDLMRKYNITAYIEKLSDEQDKRKYISYKEDDTITFFKHFSDPTYRKFYFSHYLFQHIESITNYALFYDEDICSSTIEGSGGCETDKTRELFCLRVLSKQPSKNIQTFYSALQRRLKNIPGLQKNLVMGKHTYSNYFYLPSPKIIIPPNLHSEEVEGSWEDFYLNYIECSK